jgi:hypothetical protein
LRENRKRTLDEKLREAKLNEQDLPIEVLGAKNGDRNNENKDNNIMDVQTSVSEGKGKNGYSLLFFFLRIGIL